MNKIIANLRDKIYKIPLSIVSLVTIVVSFGFILMYSAAQGNFFPWASKQMLHFALFLPSMIAISLINLKTWYKYSYLIYYATIALLLLILLLGHTAMGATRWIDLGIIKLQPSELVKISIVFVLARYFHDLGNHKITLTKLVTPIIMLIIPASLVIKQPDLGTGIIILAIGAIMFFIANVSKWFFISGTVFLAVSLPLAWQFLYDYQKNRIFNFLSPEQDRLGGGYNVIQSKIAIGSGGFFGKGFMQGTQSQLQFLPEHQTDFIFTMICEEWGFLGASLVLLAFFILSVSSYIIAVNCKSQFGRLLTIGIISMISLHVIINVAMVMGLLPAVGIPLPLLSYGGTNMLTVLAGFGLIMSAHIHNRSVIGSGF